MNTENFIQTVQTFGSSPSRWETDSPEELQKWTQTEEGIEILETEKELDLRLDFLKPPVCTELIDKIQSVIMQETLKHQYLFFWKISPWISFFCIIGGFYLGWYQNHLNDVYTESYFATMFDDTGFEQYL